MRSSFGKPLGIVTFLFFSGISYSFGNEVIKPDVESAAPQTIILSYVNEVEKSLSEKKESLDPTSPRSFASSCDKSFDTTLTTNMKEDLFYAVYFLTQDAEFKMRKGQVEKLYKEIIEFAAKPSKERIKGFRFNYLPKSSAVPSTIRIKFDQAGRALLRVPHSSVNKGASKKAEVVVQFGDWKKWVRLSSREQGIRYQCPNELNILRKIASLKATEKKGLLPEIRQVEDDIFLTFFEGSLNNKKWQKKALKDGLSVIDQLLRGLLTLHQMGIVHADIHPGNILLRNGYPDGTEAVLADFDQSIDFATYPKNKVSQENAHPAYAAPEVTNGIQFESYSEEDRDKIKKRDVFSMGIILHKLLKNRFPPLLDKCQENLFPKKLSLTKCYSEKYVANQISHHHFEQEQIFDPGTFILDRALDPDFERRLSSKQLLDAWTIYRKLQEKDRKSDIQSLLGISMGPELAGLGIHHDRHPEDIVSQLKNESPGSFAVLPLFADGATQLDNELHLYYKDSFEGVRKVEFKTVIHDLEEIELSLSFFKALGLIQEPIK